jgi:hypothetical protein
VVCSLAVTAWLQEGGDSPIFGLTVILAAIVMYDSFGVRRSSGEQAVAINMLISSLEQGKIKMVQPTLKLREILGHQPSEVVVGAVLGIVLGGVFNYDKLTSLWSFLQTTPAAVELWLYAGLFGVLLVAGLVTRFVLGAMYGKSPVMRQLRRRILSATQTTGWVGLVAVALQHERASYLAWRFWALLVVVIALVWGISLAVNAWRTVPPALAAEAQQARKLKWFNFGRKKSKKTKRG